MGQNDSEWRWGRWDKLQKSVWSSSALETTCSRLYSHVMSLRRRHVVTLGCTSTMPSNNRGDYSNHEMKIVARTSSSEWITILWCHLVQKDARSRESAYYCIVLDGVRKFYCTVLDRPSASHTHWHNAETLPVPPVIYQRAPAVCIAPKPMLQ